jgi:putative tricarboxylic transport membrane protein
MPEYAVKYWRETLAKMVKTPEWEAAKKTNGWDDAYLDAPDFAKFLVQVNEDYKIVLSEIGMLKAK